jgi:fluoride ion exporter CrcB/FEX
MRLVAVAGAVGAVARWERLPPTRYLRPPLTIGFFGAYTTCSTSTFETVRLLDDDAWRCAAWNLALSGPPSFAGALLAFLAVG